MNDELRQLEEITEKTLVRSQTDRQRSEESTKEYGSYSRLLELAKHDHCAAVVHTFRNEFRHILNFYSLYSAAEESATKNVRRFATLFPQACERAGIELDPTSRHPKYTIRGFIRTFIDTNRFEAQVTCRDARTVTVPTDIDPIVVYLKNEIKRLFETTRDSNRLLDGLQTAYMAILKEEKKRVGHELPIRRVANRLSKNWKHFRYDEFNVDLGNMVSSGKTSIGRMKLHLYHTRDIKRGMQLYGLEDDGYFDLINFRTRE